MYLKFTDFLLPHRAIFSNGAFECHLRQGIWNVYRKWHFQRFLALFAHKHLLDHRNVFDSCYVISIRNYIWGLEIALSKMGLFGTAPVFSWLPRPRRTLTIAKKIERFFDQISFEIPYMIVFLSTTRRTRVYETGRRRRALLNAQALQSYVFTFGTYWWIVFILEF